MLLRLWMEGMLAEEEEGASGRTGGGARGCTVMADGAVEGGAVATGATSPGEVWTGEGGVGLVRSPEEEWSPVSMRGRKTALITKMKGLHRMFIHSTTVQYIHEVVQQHRRLLGATCVTDARGACVVESYKRSACDSVR